MSHRESNVRLIAAVLAVAGVMYAAKPGRWFSWSEGFTTSTGIKNTTTNLRTLLNMIGLGRGVLDKIRTASGAPLHINSWFRTAAVNEAVGGVEDSDHMKGTGADVYSDAWTPLQIAEWLYESDLPIGEVYTYGYTDHIHVSWDPGKKREFGRYPVKGEKSVPWSPS